MLLNGFLSKVFIIVLGYLLPGYNTYKTLNAANNQANLKFWCTYWLVLVAFLTTEWVADAAVAWLPLYNEAKVLFVIYLWHPRTHGAVAVYDKFLHPLLRQHEAQIDSSLADANARIADGVTGYFKKAKDFAVSNASTIMDNVRKFSEEPRPQQPALQKGKANASKAHGKGHGHQE